MWWALRGLGKVQWAILSNQCSRTLDIFKKFISTVTGIQGIVGHGLESFTNKIAVSKISFPELPGFDIHFVDTPGFDDTIKSDVDIFKMISDWLHNTCVVIY